jgi:hypothetical protein
MRDFTGVPYQFVEEPMTRRSLAAIDYFLRDLSRGIKRISVGQVPDGSGNPIPGTGGSFNAADFMFLPGRSGGQTVLGITSDTSPTVVFNTAAAGTTTTGAAGTPSMRLTYATSTLCDFVPVQFAAGVYDAAIRPAAGVQVVSVDGTAGMRFVPTSSRAFIQTGILNGAGVASAKDMTIGGIGATYGASLGINFLQNYFEGGASTAPRVGMGVGSGPRSTNPVDFGANWKGVLGLTGVSVTEGALRLMPFSDTTGAPLLEVTRALTGTSPTQNYGDVLFSITHDQLGSDPVSRIRANFWGDGGVLAGYWSDVASAAAGSLWKLCSFDARSNRWLCGEGLSSMWADSKTVTFLEIGESISAFRGAAITSIDDSAFDRLHVLSLATLFGNTALGGATVAPGAMLHVRNTANAAQVLERLQPHSTQSVDIWQVRDSGDTTSRVSVDSAGTFNASRVVLGVSSGSTTVQDVTIFLAPSGGTIGGLYFDDASGFVSQVVSNGLSANRTITIPDATGQLVLTGNTVTLTLSTSGQLLSTSSSTGTSFTDSVTSSKRMRFVLSTGVGNNHIDVVNTAARGYTLYDYSGTMTVVGNTTAAAGTPGRISLTGQTGNLGTQTLLTSSANSSGLFRCTFYTRTSTTGTAGSQVKITLLSNDGNAQSTEVPLWKLAAGIVAPVTNHDLTIASAGYSGMVIVRSAASNAITFTTTGTYNGGAAYDIDARIEPLG